MRKQTLSHLYVITLAFLLVNAGVLWDFFTIIWLREISNWRIVPETWFDCKLSWFFYGFFVHMSSAMLVIMSAEKCFALYFPHKAKAICTVQNAKWMSLGVAIVYLIFDGQWFFAIKATKDQFENPVCQIIDRDYRQIFPYMDSALYTFIPVCLMVIFNVAIIFKLLLKKGVRTGNGTSKMAKQATFMLLMVTTVFIFLTMPASLCWLSMQDTYSASFVYAISFLLHMINHSINALLYVVSGSKYREGVNRLFVCRKNRIVSHSPPSTKLTNNILRSQDILEYNNEPKISEFQRPLSTLKPNIDNRGVSYTPRSPYNIPLCPVYGENPTLPKDWIESSL